MDEIIFIKSPEQIFAENTIKMNKIANPLNTVIKIFAFGIIATSIYYIIKSYKNDNHENTNSK